MDPFPNNNNHHECFSSHPITTAINSKWHLVLLCNIKLSSDMQWSKVRSLKVTLNLPVWPGNKPVVNAQSGAKYWIANVQGDYKSASTREHSGRKHIPRMAVPETPLMALVVSCVCVKRAVVLGRMPSFEKTLTTHFTSLTLVSPGKLTGTCPDGSSHLQSWKEYQHGISDSAFLSIRWTSKPCKPAKSATVIAMAHTCEFSQRKPPQHSRLFFMSNIIIPSLIGMWWQQVFLGDMTSR